MKKLTLAAGVGKFENAVGPGDEGNYALTTCAELFHTDNRAVAFGKLVGSVAK